MDIANEIEGIDRHTVEPLVREALGRDAAELIDWHLAPIHKGADLSSSVYRVAGTARDRDQEVTWSIILKVVCPTPDELGPSGWHYWKRESLAYTSGLLDNLPAGLTTPRCLRVEDHGAGCSWMWLEDIAGAQEGRWTLSDDAWVARRLGRLPHPVPPLAEQGMAAGVDGEERAAHRAFPRHPGASGRAAFPP